MAMCLLLISSKGTATGRTCLSAARQQLARHANTRLAVRERFMSESLPRLDNYLPFRPLAVHSEPGLLPGAQAGRPVLDFFNCADLIPLELRNHVPRLQSGQGRGTFRQNTLDQNTLPFAGRGQLNTEKAAGN